jgi:nitroreductase
MYDLEDVIRQRRSTRMFLPDRPVPRELIDDVLDLAMCSPSNSNIQPWHVVFASGAARDRLVAALLDAAQAAPPKVPASPERFSHFRSETGKVVYGSMGIARDDSAARRAAVLRNWEFFRAPLAGIVCMDRELGLVDSLGVGMFLQNIGAVAHRARVGNLRSSGDRGLPRDHLRTVEHPGAIHDLVRLSGRLPGSGLSSQQNPRRPATDREERHLRRRLAIGARR